MEEAVESGVLSGDPFSNQYEVNSNEKGYTEGTVGKVETGGGGVGLVGTEDTGISAVGGGTSTDGVHTLGKREEGFNGGAHHGEAGMEPVYHHGDEDDVVMADVDEEEHGVMEAGGGDARPVVAEGIHGNGGTDHTQAGVLENGKQNGGQCDPFASPDDQPMHPAQSPAAQNIYDLHSTWPQQNQSPSQQEQVQQPELADEDHFGGDREENVAERFEEYEQTDVREVPAKQREMADEQGDISMAAGPGDILMADGQRDIPMAEDVMDGQGLHQKADSNYEDHIQDYPHSQDAISAVVAADQEELVSAEQYKEESPDPYAFSPEQVVPDLSSEEESGVEQQELADTTQVVAGVDVSYQTEKEMDHKFTEQEAATAPENMGTQVLTEPHSAQDVVDEAVAPAAPMDEDDSEEEEPEQERGEIQRSDTFDVCVKSVEDTPEEKLSGELQEGVHESKDSPVEEVLAGEEVSDKASDGYQLLPQSELEDESKEKLQEEAEEESHMQDAQVSVVLSTAEDTEQMLAETQEEQEAEPEYAQRDAGVFESMQAQEAAEVLEPKETDEPSPLESRPYEEEIGMSQEAISEVHAMDKFQEGENQALEDSHISPVDGDGGKQEEELLDPIDIVYKANSEENLVGLDYGAAVIEEKNEMETEPDSLADKTEESQGQDQLLHEESVPVPADVPSAQGDVVITQTDVTESFQSTSFTEEARNEPATQGLSDVEIEPSQPSYLEESSQPVPSQDMDEADANFQSELTESDEKMKAEASEEDMLPHTDAKPPALPLLDLGDGPVQSCSLTEADQSPQQLSFEGSFSPIEDNVAVSLALQDQSGVVESTAQEESDDADTETTEVEADVMEDNNEKPEQDMTPNIQTEVPPEQESYQEDVVQERYDEDKDICELPEEESHVYTGDQSEVLQTADVTSDGILPEVSSLEEHEFNPDDQIEESFKTTQISDEFPAESDVAHEDRLEESQLPASNLPIDTGAEVRESMTPDIVMYEPEETESEIAQDYALSDHATDTTLRDTADKLLGESEDTGVDRGASATPPNTPEVSSSSPPEIFQDINLPSTHVDVTGEEPTYAQVQPEVEQVAPTDISSAVEVEQQAPSDISSAVEVEQQAPSEIVSAVEVEEQAPSDISSAVEVEQEAPSDIVSAVEVEQQAPSDISSAVEVEQQAPSDISSAVEAEQEAPSDIVSAVEVEQQAPSDIVSAVEVEQEAPSDISSAVEVEQVAPTDIVSAVEVEQQAPSDISSAVEVEQEAPSDIVSAIDVEQQAPSDISSAVEVEQEAPSDIVSAVEVEQEAPSDMISAVEVEQQAPSDMISAVEVEQEAPSDIVSPVEVATPGPAEDEAVKQESQEIQESAPEQPLTPPPAKDEEPSVAPLSAVSVLTPSPAPASKKDAVKEKQPTKKAKAPTGAKGVSKKATPMSPPKAKKSETPKRAELPRKAPTPTAKSLGLHVKPAAATDKKEPSKTPAKSPTKTAARSPAKTPAKPLTKAPTPKAPTPKAPTPKAPTPKASTPKAPSTKASTPSSTRAASSSVRSKTALPKVDSKPSEIKPKQDKAKMSAVKQKTVTTVTKTTHTEVKSGKSSPRKSADGDSPRFRQSPSRSATPSKIGSLDNNKHSPGGGNVKIQQEKSDYSRVQSRCGSMGNATHRAGGGNVKILHDPVAFSNSSSRVGSMENAHHSPQGSKVKIENKKVDFTKKVSSKIGSLDNSTHKAGGGRVKITSAKLDFKEKAASKIGSKDNIKHKAGGGKVKIENKKLDFKEKAASKVGSKDNIEHKPGGGQIKIHEEKLEFKQKAASKVGSLDNAKHQPGGGDVQIMDVKVDFTASAHSKVGSLDNADHKPAGGDIKIMDEKIDFTASAHSKVGSLDNADHKPAGGDVKIMDEKVDFTASAHSKVGSLDNADHKPAGGDLKIFDEKSTFHDVSPRTDDGIH